MAYLSLCMIACDEANHIGHAIESCRGVADEIIVVDTGSTDATREIAQSLGAKVFRQPWQDDYSAPRNLSYEMATGEWIFVIDCDERLQPSSRPLLLNACRRNLAPAYFVTLNHEPGAPIPSLSGHVRLARRDTGCRMVGRIHERPRLPFTSIAPSNIVVEHYGYQRGPSESKALRYIRLLNLELADHPYNNYLLIDLLHLYWVRQDPRWRDILPRALATLDTDAPTPAHALAAVLLEILFRLPDQVLPRDFPKSRADDLVQRWFPGAVPLLVTRMRWRIEQRDYATALALGTDALARLQTGRQQIHIAFQQQPLLGELFLQLGIANAGTGRISDARAAFSNALGFPDVAQAAQTNLTKMLTWKIVDMTPEAG